MFIAVTNISRTVLVPECNVDKLQEKGSSHVSLVTNAGEEYDIYLPIKTVITKLSAGGNVVDLTSDNHSIFDKILEDGEPSKTHIGGAEPLRRMSSFGGETSIVDDIKWRTLCDYLNGGRFSTFEKVSGNNHSFKPRDFRSLNCTQTYVTIEIADFGCEVINKSSVVDIYFGDNNIQIFLDDSSNITLS